MEQIFVVGKSVKTKRIKKCGVYAVFSPSGSVYIGQSYDIIGRFRQYNNFTNCKEQIRLYNSFMKYGIEKHKFFILQECSESELDQLECYYMDLYGSVGTKKGLNLKSGGANGRPSDETRKKMSENSPARKRRGSLHPLSKRVIQVDLQTRQPIKTWGSIIDVERELGLIGISHVVKRRNLTSGGFVWMYETDDAKEFWESWEELAKTKRVRDGRKRQKKMVAHINLQGEILKIYDGIMEAEESLGISGISEVCQLKNLSCGGLIFKYNNDESVKDFLLRRESVISIRTEKNKLAIEQKARSRKKRVVQIDIYGKEVRVFDGITDAFKETNALNISAACRGKVASAGGYLWKFLEDGISVEEHFNKCKIKILGGSKNKGKIGSLNNNHKAVIQMDCNSNPIKEWECMMDAQRDIGVNSGVISEVCNGKVVSAGGYLWKFKDETEEQMQKRYKQITKKKVILNLQTGIYYEEVKDAVNSCMISIHVLGKALTGERRNKTPFIYV